MTWFAQCLFCDDIRHEADGRMSLMGVYGTGVSGLMPMEFLCICVAVIVRWEKANPPNSLKVTVTGPDLDKLETEAPQEILEREVTTGPKSPFVLYHLEMWLENLTIRESGQLRVVVTADGEDRLAGVLNFRDRTSVLEPEIATGAGQPTDDARDH